MDPRHQQILAALRRLRDRGKTPATPIDIALELDLREPEDMGGFLVEVLHMGWAKPVNRDFQGRNRDFDLTSSGERELEAAEAAEQPPVTLEDIELEVQRFLSAWTYDQPFYPRHFRDAIGRPDLTDAEVVLLLRQLQIRDRVRPHHDDGWYPTD